MENNKINTAEYCFKRLDKCAASEIKELFAGVFTREPWNDDWSDENQLDMYIHDLIGQSNSLTFGLYEENELIGLSMGHIRHWHSGTEYYMDEFCIQTEKQGKGIGTLLIAKVEEACAELGLTHIFC